MSGLPEGWSIQSIDELCSLNPKYEPEAIEPKEVSFIPMPAVSEISGSIVENRARPFTEVKKGYTHFENGDVIFAKITPCMENGKAAIASNLINGIARGSTEFYVLRGKGAIDPKFLHRYLRQESFRKNARQNMTGAVGHARVPKNYLLSQELPLPPAKEQKRIVKKLETCEARIEAAREALSEVPQLLENYRQSVLAAAFRGDLTAKWRAQNPDAEPADQLLERLRHERRQRWEQAELEKYEAKGKAPPKDWKKKYKAPEPLTKAQIDELPELPEGWCWASPQELVSEEKYALSIGPFGSNLKKSDYQDSGMPLIFVRDIRTEFDEAKVTKYVTHEKGAELLAHQISGGDLVITKMGDPPGDISRYPIESPDAIITADCIKLRIHKEAGEPDFYKWAIRSSTVQKHIKSIAKGVAQQKVSLARFATTPIPVAPIGEQIELLRILETVENSMKFMEAAATNSAQTLDSLTQSLLAKAFRGELVPQDPNDEPASQLLERIAEKRQLKAKKVSIK